MATLEKIRGKAGLLVAVIGVALFAFIIGDFLNSGTTFFRQNGEKVVVVNGEKMTAEQFDIKMKDMTEVYQIQFGQQTLPEEYQNQIRQSVYENFVRETLYSTIFAETGITVTPEQMFDMVQGKNISPMVQQIPLFRNPQTGEFDRALMLNFLKTINDTSNPNEGFATQIAQYKKYWLFWENLLMSQKKEEKLNAILTTAVAPNKLDAKYAFDLSHKNVDLLYTAQSYSTIADSLVKVSTSDLKAAYDKQKERFKQEEVRDMAYMIAKIEPSTEDVAEIVSAMDKVKDEFTISPNVSEVVNENSDVAYNNFFQSVQSLDATAKEFASTAGVGEVKGPLMDNGSYKMFRMVATTSAPDSVRVRQIMVGTGDAKRDEFLVDSIRGLIAKGDFAKVATDLGTQNGGEIGWLTEEAAVRGLNEEFKNKCFAASAGSTFTVKSNYGTHIVKVEELTRPVRKVKMAVLSMAVVASSRTYSKLYNEINQMITNNNSSEAFIKAAGEKGYQITPTQQFSAQMNDLANIKNTRQVIRWAFNNDKGKVSPIFDCDGNFIVAAVNKVTPKGYAPLDEVKDFISLEVRNQKKGEYILSTLKGKSNTTLEAYAQTFGASIDTAHFVSMASTRIDKLGAEPVVVAKAVTAKIGELSEPIIGKSGVVVFSALKENTDEAKYDETVEKQTIGNNLMYRLMYQNFEVLRRKADIKDLRAKFF